MTEQYRLPLKASQVTKIIESEILPHKVGDEINSSNKESCHYVKNQEGKNILKIYSKKDNGLKTVQVEFLSSDDNNRNEESLGGEFIPSMFSMAVKIYGSGGISNPERIYSDMISYMKDRPASNYGSAVFENKYGDSYVSLGLNLKDGNYQLAYIRIENLESYENTIKNASEKWITSLSKKYQIKENGSVKELIDAEEDEIIKIRGKIIKQNRFSKEKEKYLKAIDEKGQPVNLSRNDYVDAIITDGKQEVPVILKINALDSEAIKEERTHYVYYSHENTVGLVEYMVK